MSSKGFEVVVDQPPLVVTRPLSEGQAPTAGRREMFARWLRQPGNERTVEDAAGRTWVLAHCADGALSWEAPGVGVFVFATPYWNHSQGITLLVRDAKDRDLWHGEAKAPESWPEYLDAVRKVIRVALWHPGDPCPLCGDAEFQEVGTVVMTEGVEFEPETRTWVRQEVSSDICYDAFDYLHLECASCAAFIVPEYLASMDEERPVPARRQEARS